MRRLTPSKWGYDTVPFKLFTHNFPAVQPIDIAPGTAAITCDLTFDSGVVATGTRPAFRTGGRSQARRMIGVVTYHNIFHFVPLEGLWLHGVRIDCRSLAPRGC